MYNLTDPIKKIRGIGLYWSKKLKKLGINTTRDFLWYFPYRYQDYSKLTKISKAKIGEIAVLKGRIISLNTLKTPRRRIFLTQAILEDETGSIKLVWFNQPFIKKMIKKDTNILIAGKVVRDKYGLSIQSPEYEIIAQNPETRAQNFLHIGRIVPIYPETKGLSSKMIRKNIWMIMNEVKVEDYLPLKIIKKYQLIKLSDAIKKIHFPRNMNEIKEARKRLGFDEIFFLQLENLISKKKWQENLSPIIKINKSETLGILKKLPYELTKAQKLAAAEILLDLGKKHPANRLLQGDVGSGKTVVAALAMANAAISGYQSILMAPTEILAKQHFETLKKIFSHLNLQIALLTSSKAELFCKKPIKISKIKLKKLIKNGKIKIVAGTHALIAPKMKYKKLGLIIVDEQHRFGVSQRAELRKKSKLHPHLLTMTATPIPRTLSLAVFGDLDLSIIDEKPLGRQKIITKVIRPEKRTSAYGFIENQIKSGKQAFVICPLIEKKKDESKTFDYDNRKAAVEEYKKLSKKIFPQFKIGLLHGKLKPKIKNQIMEDFTSKKFDILVSTSVVEVGVDVPNATIMMIEGAQCFGLAQLHQFRGRVGRNKYQSYCLLFSDSDAYSSIQRLKAMENTDDGFKLAEIDLKFRGPGEIYGVKQSGYMNLKIAEITDSKLILQTRQAAQSVINNLKKYPKLQEIVNDKHKKSLE